MERKFFLTTPRIGFSTWSASDLPLARLLWGDPQVTRYICAEGIFRDSDIESRLRLEICNGTLHHVQYWPIFHRESMELIGCCGLRPHESCSYEIGFHLRPGYWRQGYASEAAKAVISHAFTVLQADSLFAGHNPRNIASRNLLQKLGFVFLEDCYYEPTGLYHPSYVLTR